MSPAPAVVLVLAAGVPADALSLTAELLGHLGVAFKMLTVPASLITREETARELTPGTRAVVVACADQEIAALWAKSGLPVIRVPATESETIADRLALLVPVAGGAAAEGFATVAIGHAGARNAALFVVSMLAAQGDIRLGQAWSDYRRTQTETVLGQVLPV